MNRALLLAVIAACATHAPSVEERSAASIELAQNARELSTEIYRGEHVFFLTTPQQQTVASMVADLEHLIAVREASSDVSYWLGYFRVLQAEDLRNRGDRAGSDARLNQAVAVLEPIARAKPAHPWASYELGVALANLGRLREAALQLHAAESSAAQDYAEPYRFESMAIVRRQALSWLGDVRLQLLDFELASDSFERALDLDGGGEFERSHRRFDVAFFARDFETAATELQSLQRQQPEVESHPAELGSLAALSGNAEAAERHLDRAIECEAAPSVYTRLWRWMIAPVDREAVARKLDFELLVDPLSRPSSVTAWDSALLRFVIDAGIPEESFLEQLNAERARRRTALELGEELEMEAWTYIGVRRELNGELESARRAYRQALEVARPARSSWELELARTRFSSLSRRLPADDAPHLVSDDGRVTLRPVSPIRALRGSTEFHIEKWRSPALGDRVFTEFRSAGSLALALDELRPGDVVQATGFPPGPEAATMIFGIDF